MTLPDPLQRPRRHPLRRWGVLLAVIVLLVGTVSVSLARWSTRESFRGVLAVEYGTEVLDAYRGELLLADEDGVSRVWAGFRPSVSTEAELDGRVVQGRLIRTDPDDYVTSWLAVVETGGGTRLERRTLDRDFELTWSVRATLSSRLRAVGDGVAVIDRGRFLVGVDLETGRIRWREPVGEIVAPALEPGDVDRPFFRASLRSGQAASMATTSGDVDLGYETADAAIAQATEDEQQRVGSVTMKRATPGTLATLRYRLGDHGYVVRTVRDGDDPGIVYLKREPHEARTISNFGVVLADAADCPAARRRDLQGRVVVVL